MSNQPPDRIERAVARSVPAALTAIGMLGAIALILCFGLLKVPSPHVEQRAAAFDPTGPITSLRPQCIGPRAAPLSTSITPITSLAGAASGFAYSGQAYEVLCTVATDTVTLYGVVHNGTAWEGPILQYPCTLDPSKSTKGTCYFPARVGTDLTWNAFKTGSGTVSSCTAQGLSGQMPGGMGPPASGPGSGTVTSIDCQTGLICTPDPIVSTGTIAPDFGTAVGKVVQGGVVSGATCAYPTSVVYNDAGQVTSCTAGSAPSGGNAIYGDGSDGNATITGGTTTLTRDMFYDQLTVDATGVLANAGFRIYCKTSCTVASGGRIQNNGEAASADVPGGGGLSSVLGGGAIGGAGATAAGGAGNASSSSLGGNGGAGGTGSSPGGAGGLATAPAASYGGFRAMPQASLGTAMGGGTGVVQFAGGAAGGGGGGDGVNPGGGGGGGGGGVIVVAKTLTLAGTGAIRANGGAGAAGTAGNAAGGGGGGGGVVVIVYGTRAGAGTVTASGGAAGAGVGSGAAGTAGSAGTVIELAN